MHVFNETMLKKFKDRMLRYLAKHFPELCSAENEKAVREFIQKGIERSKFYGITDEQNVARYIDLMFRFTEGFETEKWAADILKNPDLRSRTKMEQLWNIAKQKASNPTCQGDDDEAERSGQL